MKLPPLPNQHKKQEANFGIDLKHYTERTQPDTRSIETKDTRGKDSLPFSAVEPAQIAFAKAISSDKGAWIRTLGMNGEPDYIWLRNEPAYIFIKYPKGTVGITIGNFLHEKDTSKRKSLTWERAVAIGGKVIHKKA